jgi:hypothetical protein
LTDFSGSVSPQRCRGTATILADKEVVGGTGGFVGASGGFDSTLNGKASGARNADGSCALDQPPLHEDKSS